MATCNGSTTKLLPDVHMEAAQSVMPFKITDPRQVRRVSVPQPSDLGSIFGQCLHILLCYTKAAQEDSRWFHVGWIKESLARALLDQPLFAGRFREVNKNEDRRDLEIVSNDSGIRFIESRIPVTLSEFLGSKDREDGEAKLVFWKDVDEHSPQYSPLFYVQVTKFQCGGCSIGISCSLLLADLLFKENFLKKWANIHNHMLSKNDLPSTPRYYMPNIVTHSNCSPATVFFSYPIKTSGQTMVFDIEVENVDSENDALQLCVEEALSKFGSRLAPKSSWFVKTNTCNAIKVENFPRKQGLVSPKLILGGQVNGAIWDGFGANEVEFREGYKPASVSYGVGFSSGGILVVMAMPSSAAYEKGAPPEVKVIVTVPNEKEF